MQPEHTTQQVGKNPSRGLCLIPVVPVSNLNVVSTQIRRRLESDRFGAGSHRVPFRQALRNFFVIAIVVFAVCQPASAQKLTIPPTEQKSDETPRSGTETGSPQTDQPSNVRTFSGSPTAESDLGLPSRKPLQSASVPVRTESHAAHDLSITVATSLLARFVNDRRQESDPVATRVMEASVSGMQTTTTDVRLQSVSCPTRAHLQIQTDGTVSSTTVGITPQAAVNTLGSHTFQVMKPVYFDGKTFLTKQAYGSLQARQYPQSVNTTVARTFPLLGRLGNQIAWREVYRRMPMTDAIVVRRVADDVLPTVNTSVDKQLVQLNRKWSSVRRQVERLTGVANLNWSTASANTSLTVALTNPAIPRGKVKPSELDTELREKEVCCLLIDELAVNSWLDRQRLDGLELSDMDLKQMATELQDLIQRPTDLIRRLQQGSLTGNAALLFTVKLDSRSPVRVFFRDGQLHLSTRFQIIPRIGQPGIMQQVTVGLQGEAAPNDQWAIVIKEIEVAPAETDEEPDAWTNVIRTQLNNLRTNQDPSPISRVLQASRWDERFPDLKLDRVQAIDGLLRVAFKSSERSLSL